MTTKKLDITQLEPTAVWTAFTDISTIPRCSKQEEKIKDFFADIAKKNKYPLREDSGGNLVIYKDAHPLRAGSDPIALQAHLDMVCVKTEGSSFDFSTDPLRLRQENGWVSAVDTSLGADNGIGLAMIYALLDSKEYCHAPLEIVLTVDEESALVGACSFDGTLLRSRRLLNLDSEEDDVLYIGCAGGQTTRGKLELKKQAPLKDASSFLLAVSGLWGGHSGIDIDKGRVNAILCLIRVLALWKGRLQFALLEGGGEIHNVIPSYAEARVHVPSADAREFTEHLHRAWGKIRQEYASSEPNMEFDCRMDTGELDPALSEEDSRKLINTLLCFPNGILSMCKKIGDLVETSSNLAGVKLCDNMLYLVSSQRSLHESCLDIAGRKASAALELAGGEAHFLERYPAWPPQLSSPLLAKVKKIYHHVVGSEAKTRVVHAGLECGALCSRIPEMEALSFGPDIENPHSVFERVRIASVQKIWNFLLKVLEEL